MQSRQLRRISTIACFVTSFIVPAAWAAEPLRNLSTLTVVDSNGQRVGVVSSLFIQLPFSMNVGALVAFAVGQQPFVLRVSAQGITTGNGLPLYVSGDCSGQPFVSEPLVTNSLIEPAVVSAPGHTIYVSEPDAEPQQITPGSQLTQNGCQPASVGSGEMLPARAVVDFDTLFTPPFSVR